MIHCKIFTNKLQGQKHKLCAGCVTSILKLKTENNSKFWWTHFSFIPRCSSSIKCTCERKERKTFPIWNFDSNQSFTFKTVSQAQPGKKVSWSQFSDWVRKRIHEEKGKIIRVYRQKRRSKFRPILYGSSKWTGMDFLYHRLLYCLVHAFLTLCYRKDFRVLFDLIYFCWNSMNNAVCDLTVINAHLYTIILRIQSNMWHLKSFIRLNSISMLFFQTPRYS